MAFALIAVLWAIFGRIDVVATALGKIMPNDRTKVIQPMETAVVKAIHVRDGQAVQAGQVLIELDATTATADSERLGNEALTARLEALAPGPAGGAGNRASRRAGTAGRADAARPARRRSSASSTASTANTRPLSAIEAEIASREAELPLTQEQSSSKLEQTAPIARQRARGLQGPGEEELHLQARLSGNGADTHRTGSRIWRSPEESPEELARRIDEAAAAARHARRRDPPRSCWTALNEAEQKATGSEQELVKSDSAAA